MLLLARVTVRLVVLLAVETVVPSQVRHVQLAVVVVQDCLVVVEVEALAQQQVVLAAAAVRVREPASL